MISVTDLCSDIDVDNQADVLAGTSIGIDVDVVAGADVDDDTNTDIVADPATEPFPAPHIDTDACVFLSCLPQALKK